ncbi:MAG: diadenylate cyclase CdaA [Erysipelotrichaceae bacterium]|nr:diadenylate cyclase CdaA [Erysipelotrichaceae bacterium]
MSFHDIILILRLVLDVSILTALVYTCVRLVRDNSRTIQIVKGILALLIFKALIDVLQLKTIGYLLDFFLRWGIIVILIVLQPEIRSILEQVGKTNANFVPDLPVERMNKMIEELVKAVSDMAKTKTGALISLQMGQSLEEYAKTGIKMDSDVTAELLETIFQYGTPMHDGAVIIVGDKIACAAAYYPSTAKDLPSKYGARHRAAVGISEVSDSITLIVSEETGNISIAQKGTLTQYTPESLYRYLVSRLIQPTENRSSVFQPVLDSARSLSNSLTRGNRNKEEKRDDRIRPLSVLNLLPDSALGNSSRIQKKQDLNKKKKSGGEGRGL